MGNKGQTTVKVVTRKLEELKPYANNPRQNDNAVAAVAESIRQFGWQQPIVVDENDIILVGHTRFKAATGAYGIIVEGMKHSKAAPGLVRIAADYAIDYETIRSDFLMIRERGHELGLKVYAGENRIRELGDSLTCCGTDGVEGFKPNTFNINHFIHGDFTKPTEGQKKTGTADCFGSLNQTTAYHYMLKKNSFASMMAKFAKEKKALCRDVFGLSKK